MKFYNINTETPAGLIAYKKAMQPDSLIFQEIEKHFNQWIENTNPASEYHEMYFGDDAILSKKGAIQEGINHLLEIMQEENLPFIYLNHPSIDFDAVFQY